MFLVKTDKILKVSPFALILMAPYNATVLVLCFSDRNYFSRLLYHELEEVLNSMIM